MFDFNIRTVAAAFFLAIAIVIVAGYSVGPLMNNWAPKTGNFLIGAANTGIGILIITFIFIIIAILITHHENSRF